jgi:hypothetical protein
MAENEKWKIFEGKEALLYHPSMTCSSNSTIEIHNAEGVRGERKQGKKNKYSDLQSEETLSKEEPSMHRCLLSIARFASNGDSVSKMAEKFFRTPEDVGGRTCVDDRFILGNRKGVLKQHFNRDHQLVRALAILTDSKNGRPDGILSASLRFDGAVNIGDIRTNFDLLPLFYGILNRLELLPHWTGTHETCFLLRPRVPF